LVGEIGASENTLRSHIKYLSIKGFLKVSYQIGKHEGATYEVFIPEEMGSSTNPSQVVPSSTNENQELSRSTDNSQQLVLGTSQQLGDVGTTLMPGDIGQNDTLRLKKDNTKNDDDRRVSDALAVLGIRLDIAAKKITGKGISKAEADKWGSLADLLILELEIAASRAESISSVPAFLTEVLRRQFFASRQQFSTKPGKAKIDMVGKPDVETYEIKPLDKKGRGAALEQLREFAGDEFLQDFEKWYTEEDWNWLMQQLEKE
jgi:hypothetical protein